MLDHRIREDALKAIRLERHETRIPADEGHVQPRPGKRPFRRRDGADRRIKADNLPALARRRDRPAPPARADVEQQSAVARADWNVGDRIALQSADLVDVTASRGRSEKIRDGGVDRGIGRPIPFDTAPELVGNAECLDIERAAAAALRGPQRRRCNSERGFLFGQQEHWNSIHDRIDVSVGTAETAVFHPKLRVVARTPKQREKPAIDAVGWLHVKTLNITWLVPRSELKRDRRPQQFCITSCNAEMKRIRVCKFADIRHDDFLVDDAPVGIQIAKNRISMMQ